MKPKIWEIALAIALVVTLVCGFTLDREQTELSEKLIRLHVVANSDTEEDQALKLKVRDSILGELTVLLSGVEDKTEAQEIIGSHLKELCKAAQRTIRAEGYNYAVTTRLMTEDFPTRNYTTFSLPAGKYTALRVTIGAGEGHNWWCVIFPPLCAGAATTGDASDMGLTDDEIGLITESSGKYVIRFKAIEIFSAIRSALGA